MVDKAVCVFDGTNFWCHFAQEGDFDEHGKEKNGGNGEVVAWFPTFKEALQFRAGLKELWKEINGEA